MTGHTYPFCLCILASLLAGSFTTSLRGQTTQFNGVSVPGTVIQHSPASSGIYLGSPSIAILSNGDLIASHDYFGPNSGTPKRTAVYRSTDAGQSWTALSTIFNLTWAGLFAYSGDLYALGTNAPLGNLVIRKSVNGGASWTLASGPHNGILRQSTPSVGFGTAPVPVVVSDGRIWRAYEEAGASNTWVGQFRAGLMSAPIDSDLLNAASWEYTNVIEGNEQWLPYVPSIPNFGGYFNGWLEGNAVVDPQGNVANVLRVDVEAGWPEHAAITHAENSGSLAFNPQTDIFPMSGGAKKFSIRYNETTGTYWTLANIVNDDNDDPSKPPAEIRNIVALMQSADLQNWTTEEVLLQDLTDPDHIGFQYLDWQFDGRDIIALSRTAHPDGLGGAANYHDSNFITFHRFVNVLPAAQIEGDLNGDGFVGIADLNIVLSAWNQNVPPGDPLADPTGDGFVGIEDLNMVLGNWNTGTPPKSSASPEPASLVFLLISVSVAGLRRI